MKMFGKNTIGTYKGFVLLLGVLVVMFGCAHQPSVETEPQETEASVPATGKVISQVTVSEGHNESTVSIQGNTSLTYTAVKHQFPLGVVLYFPETSLEGVEKDYAPEGTLIKTIHTSEMERKTPASRIEIRLAQDAPYEVKRAENAIQVTFKAPMEQKTVETTASHQTRDTSRSPHVDKRAQTGDTSTAGDDSTVSARASAATPTHPDEARTSAAAVVKAIDFQALEDGKSRLTVKTNQKASYEARKSSPKHLLLTLHNTRIPEFQRRPLITTRFRSAVDRILPVQSEKSPDTAVISIDLREAVPYIVYQEGNSFTVDFAASTIPPRPMAQTDKPEWVQATKTAQAVILTQEPEEMTAGTPARLPGAKKTYTGERISLDFQDADIHNIFRILHEVSGKNFVIGDDVSGNVTLKLVNVPWDQVLDLILKMNNLGTIEEGNIVRIATLSSLEAEQRALTQKAKAEQEAQKLSPLVTEFIKLDYADATSLKGHLEEIKSERGKITIDKPTNMIIIKDERNALEEAKVLISQLDKANQEIATRQVMIEARIVEADTNFTRDIGVQWGGDYSASGSDGNAALTGELFGVDAANDSLSTTTPNFAVNLPPSSVAGGIGFNFGRIGGTALSLDLRLLAMEENGNGRTISSPKVLTLDNKKATIKQITKIPYQVTEDNTTSIETEDAGIELSVTPQITRDNRIRMVIFAEKGAPDWSNTVNGNPAIDTNTAETELFVNDGQTIVIGGILTTTDTYSQTGLPWLSKLPFLGWLFKQKQTVKDKNELLIFITPKIVRLEEAPRIDS